MTVSNAFNTTIHTFQTHADTGILPPGGKQVLNPLSVTAARVIVMRSGVAESARSMRSHPPQSETHTAGSRAFLAHPKEGLAVLVKSVVG